MPHTAEPWEFKGRSLYEKDTRSNEIAFFGDEQEDVLNGERAARCVNALAGLSDDALNGGWCFKEISAHAKWLEDENASVKKELESERRMFNRAIRELAEIAELCGGDENAIAIDCVKDLLAARQA